MPPDMKSSRKLLASAAGALLLVALTAQVAMAQTPVDPSTTPVQNDSATAPITPFGIRISFAALLLIMGLATVLFLVIMYMRYAPRFSKDEEALKVVRADRVVLGQELPRRNVDLSQAAPVIVAPPALPTALAAAAAPGAGPTAAAEAVAPAPDPAAALAAPAPVAEAPPLAEEPAPTPAPTPAPASAEPAERVEVTMDQDVFERTLQELLDAGTDRRIAEGKARRAGMIAAKKAAAGEA
jgi:hypothetical protein